MDSLLGLDRGSSIGDGTVRPRGITTLTGGTSFTGGISSSISSIVSNVGVVFAERAEYDRLNILPAVGSSALREYVRSKAFSVCNSLEPVRLWFLALPALASPLPRLDIAAAETLFQRS